MNTQLEHDLFLSMPLKDQERQWIMERLDTLSVKEQHQLVAAIRKNGTLKELLEKTGWERKATILRMNPEMVADAVNCLLSLDEFEVCFPAGSYQQLGGFYLRHETHLPARAMHFADLDKLGQWYEDQHPGLFIGSCYVAYPPRSAPSQYIGQGDIPEDDGWSMKVKLSSPAVPGGAWLRLPDHSLLNGGRPDEVEIALAELGVSSLTDCCILDIRCSLPAAGDLMEQYTDIVELIRDGNDLGYMLEEQGQGMPRFIERFAAALELEHCRDLKFALDIGQNLHCYDWIPCNNLKDFGRRKLVEVGAPEGLLDSGCIDLESYAVDLLEGAGYVLTADANAYIARNSQEFICERSHSKETKMTLQ